MTPFTLWLKVVPMASTRAFSLIETLVAITIASIATLALMRVISHASNASAKAIERFDSSIMMGLVVTELNDVLSQGKSMNMDELLVTRYAIDNPSIRDFLKSTTYEIRVSQNEVLNTPMNVIDMTTSINQIVIQKVFIQNGQNKAAFFRLTDGSQ